MAKESPEAVQRRRELFGKFIQNKGIPFETLDAEGKQSLYNRFRVEFMQALEQGFQTPQPETNITRIAKGLSGETGGHPRAAAEALEAAAREVPVEQSRVFKELIARAGITRNPDEPVETYLERVKDKLKNEGFRPPKQRVRSATNEETFKRLFPKEGRSLDQWMKEAMTTGFDETTRILEPDSKAFREGLDVPIGEEFKPSKTGGLSEQKKQQAFLKFMLQGGAGKKNLTRRGPAITDPATKEFIKMQDMMEIAKGESDLVALEPGMESKSDRFGKADIFSEFRQGTTGREAMPATARIQAGGESGLVAQMREPAARIVKGDQNNPGLLRSFWKQTMGGGKGDMPKAMELTGEQLDSILDQHFGRVAGDVEISKTGASVRIPGITPLEDIKIPQAETAERLLFRSILVDEMSKEGITVKGYESTINPKVKKQLDKQLVTNLEKTISDIDENRLLREGKKSADEMVQIRRDLGLSEKELQEKIKSEGLGKVKKLAEEASGKAVKTPNLAFSPAEIKANPSLFSSVSSNPDELMKDLLSRVEANKEVPDSFLRLAFAAGATQSGEDVGTTLISNEIELNKKAKTAVTGTEADVPGKETGGKRGFSSFSVKKSTLGGVPRDLQKLKPDDAVRIPARGSVKSLLSREELELTDRETLPGERRVRNPIYGPKDKDPKIGPPQPKNRFLKEAFLQGADDGGQIPHPTGEELRDQLDTRKMKTGDERWLTWLKWSEREGYPVDVDRVKPHPRLLRLESALLSLRRNRQALNEELQEAMKMTEHTNPSKAAEARKKIAPLSEEIKELNGRIGKGETLLGLNGKRRELLEKIKYDLEIAEQDGFLDKMKKGGKL